MDEPMPQQAQAQQLQQQQQVLGSSPPLLPTESQASMLLQSLPISLPGIKEEGACVWMFVCCVSACMHVCRHAFVRARAGVCLCACLLAIDEWPRWILDLSQSHPEVTVVQMQLSHRI